MASSFLPRTIGKIMQKYHLVWYRILIGVNDGEHITAVKVIIFAVSTVPVPAPQFKRYSADIMLYSYVAPVPTPSCIWQYKFIHKFAGTLDTAYNITVPKNNSESRLALPVDHLKIT